MNILCNVIYYYLINSGIWSKLEYATIKLLAKYHNSDSVNKVPADLFTYISSYNEWDGHSNILFEIYTRNGTYASCLWTFYNFRYLLINY